MRYDICVIGAGASGLACAVTAAGRGASVIVLEKNDSPGKKIFATGNGRCNIMNSECPEMERVKVFFRGLGLEMKEEAYGRLYPMSEQASDVVFVLEKALNSRGAKLVTGAAVTGVRRDADGFTVEFERSASAGTGSGSKHKDAVTAGKVVICAGGKAGPMYGSTGDGYRWARALGHTVGRLAPALTGIETEEDMDDLAGVRAACNAALLKRGEKTIQTDGRVQFTDYGLSGICIFDLTRYIILDDETDFADYEVALDIVPDMTEEELADLLGMRLEAPDGQADEDLFRTIVPEKLARTAAARVFGTNGTADLSDGAESVVLRAAAELKSMKFRVSGTRGWKMAQVTRGGVSLDEIDQETMQSMICPGLYFAGEITDFDGPCGGYNLYNAWITGIKAGEAASQSGEAAGV